MLGIARSSAERCEELLEAARADEEPRGGGGRSHRVISDEELLGERDYNIDDRPRSYSGDAIIY